MIAGLAIAVAAIVIAWASSFLKPPATEEQPQQPEAAPTPTWTCGAGSARS